MRNFHQRHVTELPSGLTVASANMAFAESIAVGFWIRAGARDEKIGENGIAHMLEHMAFKGTPSRTAADIARQIEDVGGVINAHTSREETAYYVRLLPENLDFGLDLLADIICHSTFPEDEIIREKGVIIQEIGQSHDAPDDMLFDVFQSLCYPHHSVGRTILGGIESVTNLTRQNLTDFMARYYGTSNIIIAAAGHIDHDDLVAKATKYLGDLPLKTPYPTRKTPVWAASNMTRRDMVVKDLEQTHFILGLPGISRNDPDRWPMIALSILYGGGMSSRLFQEVREKRGLCYSVFSFAQMLSDHGVFGVYAGTDAESIEEFITVAAGELADLTTHTTEDELARAIAQMRSSLVMRQENVFKICESLPRQLIQDGELMDVEDQIRTVESVDKAALEKVVARILKGKPVCAAIGDKRIRDCAEIEKLDRLFSFT